MYAVFLSGGKQYRVMKNQTIRLEKLDDSIGTNVDFNKVLMISNKQTTEIGNPFISGVKIRGTIKKHGRLKKINIIKFNCRKHYKKKQGHRQYFTEVKIIDINNIPQDTL